jgi:hypothetical protein
MSDAQLRRAYRFFYHNGAAANKGTALSAIPNYLLRSHRANNDYLSASFKDVINFRDQERSRLGQTVNDAGNAVNAHTPASDVALTNAQTSLGNRQVALARINAQYDAALQRAQAAQQDYDNGISTGADSNTQKKLGRYRKNAEESANNYGKLARDAEALETAAQTKVNNAQKAFDAAHAKLEDAYTVAQKTLKDYNDKFKNTTGTIDQGVRLGKILRSNVNRGIKQPFMIDPQHVNMLKQSFIKGNPLKYLKWLGIGAAGAGLVHGGVTSGQQFTENMARAKAAQDKMTKR